VFSGVIQAEFRIKATADRRIYIYNDFASAFRSRLYNIALLKIKTTYIPTSLQSAKYVRQTALPSLPDHYNELKKCPFKPPPLSFRDKIILKHCAHCAIISHRCIAVHRCPRCNGFVVPSCTIEPADLCAPP